MPDRLSAADAALLALGDVAPPRHAGSVAVFRRPRSGFDHAALVEHALARAPRLRQRVAAVPGRLARPVWVDDPDFAVAHHVRRTALPPPGGDAQLADLVARVMARPLDRDRPLWAAYLVDGLAGGRIALITKTHQVLADRAVDLAAALLADAPHEVGAPRPWRPRTPPGAVRLVADAVTDTLRRPAELLDNTRATVSGLVGAGARVAGALGLRPAAAAGPRRFAVARARLGDLRAIGAAHGGTVNDVVLAVVTGALRAWLRSRGEPLTAVRAEVPADARVVDLPVAEPDPVTRLRRISAGRPASPGARGPAAAVAVTAVPGPRYAGRARLAEVFPVPAPTGADGLAVGAACYGGGVYFGLTAARSDVDALAAHLGESVVELGKA
ncbi:wax ester/triacylglycerol synthase domain-containing protein [Actinokineospora sp. NPDC004072]